MKFDHTMKTAAAALLAAAALGGCGSSSDGPSPIASSTTPVSSSPAVAATTAGQQPSAADTAKAKWASDLCSTLTAKAKPIQPPSVATTTPADTLKSLQTFFTTVVDTQTIQLQALKSVGEPPSDNATADWKKAIKELRAIRKRVTKVQKGLATTSADNKTQIAKIIADVGEQTKALSSYNGPVSALAENGAVGPSLKAEPSCGALL